MMNNLDDIRKKALSTPGQRIAVAAADDGDILHVAATATQMGLSKFIFIGDQEKIEAIIADEGLAESLADARILNIPDHGAAAKKMVSLIKEGDADIPMKGNMQTGLFLHAVLDKETGIRGDGFLSEISVTEKPSIQELMLITDCAINIAPDLEAKKKIIENAIKLARIIGIDTPRIALVAAIELINPAMQETVDAAILSKMADRGQIKNAIVDGPFALDNAVSPESARHKGITGHVAGKADILVMSDIRMGNVLHKAITYFAKKRVAVAVIGAERPLLMSSRSDSIEDKIDSIALACILSNEDKLKR